MATWSEKYTKIRKASEQITLPLSTEDCVVQPVAYVSPIKWHLAHTTWFFETFILKALPNYKCFKEEYAFLFNSYYESEGEQWIRANRGNLTRPMLQEVMDYRHYVDDQLLNQIDNLNANQIKLLELGLNHEQQHQELMYYDLKYILGHNPLFPIYSTSNPFDFTVDKTDIKQWIDFKKQVVSVGHKGETFCYDNELGNHEVLVQDFSVSSHLVTNEEYLAFIKDGGYQDFSYWLSDGWDWIKDKGVQAPKYWYNKNNAWYEYELDGLKPLNKEAVVKHISFYEADAFARYKACRLLTEFEWEHAAPKLVYGQVWEWTQSAYLPYPGFEIAAGAVGEYNGKFMVNQKVLRGGSLATPEKHFRNTYRNFFSPHLRWVYSGIRLAR